MGKQECKGLNRPDDRRAPARTTSAPDTDTTPPRAFPGRLAVRRTVAFVVLTNLTC